MLTLNLVIHIVAHIKYVFTRYGIPDIFTSDNGPQCACVFIMVALNVYALRND